MTTETLEKANRLHGKIRHIKSEIDSLSKLRKGDYGKSLGIVEKEGVTSNFFNTALSCVSKQALDAALCAMLNDLEGQLATLKEELEAL